jgi:hypothetical protein
MWRWALAEKLAPYVVQIPKAFLELNDQEVIDWFNYDHKWKQDINFNLDFGDAVTNITNSESFETSSSSSEYQSHKDYLEQIEDNIPIFQRKEFMANIKSTNYSAVDHDFIDARLNSIITLIPSSGAQIITANGDGTNIRVTSSMELRYAGRRGYTFNLNNEGTSIHWYLFESDNEQFWRGS